MATTIDDLQIEISSNSQDAVSGLDALSNSLQRLKTAARGGAGLTTTVNQLNKLNTALRGIESPSGKILEIVNALKPLGTLGKTNLNSTLNSLKKLPEITKLLADIDMGAFASQINRVTDVLRPLANEMNKVANGFKAFPAKIQKIITQNDKLTRSNQRTTKSYGLLGSGITSVQAKLGIYYFALRRLSRIMSGWLVESNDYVENLNLFTIAMREGTQEALNYARVVNEAVGIDVSEWIRYQAVFQNMASGFGIASDKASIMSKNLTQLGYDLASVFNVNFDVAMEKLESAISGQPRPMREWGFDISETTLKMVALNLGVKENVENMTQMNKAQLRYIQLIDTAKRLGITGDFARTLITPANALRVLNQQIVQLKRALGNLMIPILIKVIPYVQAFVVALKDAINTLAIFFGFELPDIDYSGLGSATSSLTDMSEGTDDVTSGLGKANKVAKELKRTIMGFDELNVLSDNSASEGAIGSGRVGVGGGAGVDLGLPLDGYDFLEGLNKQTKELQEKMKKLLKVIGLIGLGLLSWKIADKIYHLFTGANVGKALFTNIGKIIKAFKPSGSTIKLASLFGNSTAYVSTATVIAGIASTILVMVTRTVDLVKNSERFKDGVKAIGDIFKTSFDWVIDTAFPKVQSYFNKIIPEDAIKAVKDFFGQFEWLVDAIDLDFKDLLITLGGIGSLFTPAAPFGIALLGFEALTLGVRAMGWWASDVVEEIDVLGEGISDITKEKMEPFLNQMRDLDDTLTEIDWTNLKIDDNVVKDVEKKTKAIADTIVSELDADKNEALKTLEPLREALGEKAYNELVKDNEKYYSDMVKKIRQGEATITSIMEKASKENRQLTEDEKREINRIRDEMNKTGIKHLSETEVEYNTIMRRLKDNTTRVSLEQASEIIKNAKKTKEETIKAAETQYTKQLMEAQRMLDVGAINKDEYDAIVKAARQTRDKTVTDAEKQYTDIYDTTTEKLGDTAKYVDEETGDIKSKWQVFTENLSVAASEGWQKVKEAFKEKWASIYGWLQNNVFPKFTKKYWKDKFWGMVDGAKSALSELKRRFEGWKAKIKLPHFSWDYHNGIRATGVLKKTLDFLNLPTTIPKFKVRWYQGGGLPDIGELFVAREAGPELVGSIGRRTAVANNDQIVEAVSQGVARAVASVSGTGEPVIENYIYFGDDKIYQSVQRAKRAADRRYQTTATVI